MTISRRTFLGAATTITTGISLLPRQSMAANAVRVSAKPTAQNSAKDLEERYRALLTILRPMFPNMGDRKIDEDVEKDFAKFLKANSSFDVGQAKEIATTFEAAHHAQPVQKHLKSQTTHYRAKGMQLAHTRLAVLGDDGWIDPNNLSRKSKVAFFNFLERAYIDKDNIEAVTARHTLLATRDYYDKEGNNPPFDTAQTVKTASNGAQKQAPVHNVYFGTDTANTVAGIDWILDQKYKRIIHAFGVVMDVCERMRFPFSVFEQLFNSESLFDPLASNPSRAAGLGQFMPDMWLGVIAKLPAMPRGGEIQAEIKKHWPEFENIQKDIQDKNLGDDTELYAMVMDKRFDPTINTLMAMALALDNEAVIRSKYGWQKTLGHGLRWLANVIGAGRTREISVAHPNTSVDQLPLSISKIERTQNPFLFSSSGKALTVGQVLARANASFVKVANLLAAIHEPQLLTRRNTLVAKEIGMVMAAQRPATQRPAPTMAMKR